MKIAEIIKSLEEQAEEKDRLSGGDPDSEYTHEADALIGAAKALIKFKVMEEDEP